MVELNKIYNEDCLSFLTRMPDNFINCCITSPPYYGLRDYGIDGQLGLEATPDEYVKKLVQIFSEVKRVMKDDGTLWLNLGDSYWSNTLSRKDMVKPDGIKPKDLMGIPWSVAFALRADGWYLRQDIIWHKPNPMPESVTDRCTKSHEYIFLLSKSARYYYDAGAIKEKNKFNGRDNIPQNNQRGGKVESMWGNRPASDLSIGEYKTPDGWDTGPGSHGAYHRNGREQGFKGYEHRGTGDKTLTGHSGYYDQDGNLIGDGKANKRSVWTVPTMPFFEAHFATFPEALITPCIKAGCPEGGIVLDPFMGAGTTALVAHKLNRNYIGAEISPDYCRIADKRILPHKIQSKINFDE